MALWDNISKKASETTAKAVQQAKILSETTRLNGLVSDEEKKITNNYYQIGKLYAAMHQNDYEEEFAGMIAAVAESEQKVKAYRVQIQNLKGVIRCENCGAEVAKGVAFCSACGSAMPKVEAVDSGKYTKCARCGAAVEKGMRFCTSCGANMIASAPISSALVEGLANPVCTECGTPIEAGMSFCATCGKPVGTPQFAANIQETSMRVFCSNCGAELDADTVFCTECGAKV